MKQTFLRAAALFFAAMMLFGCAEKEERVGDFPGEAGDGVSVTLKIPGPVTAGSYAMTAKQECDIVTVDMLVFGPDGRFLYREKGAGISDGATDTERTFSVKIRKTLDPNTVSALFYANVRGQVDAAVEGPGAWITTGTTKEEVIGKLVFDLPEDQVENQGGKWLVLPGRYTRFPMWGQSATIDLTAASIVIPPVRMLRSVARIDVGVAFPTSGTAAEQDVAAGQNNFFLEEFYLYNASNKLQVAPTPSSFDGTAVTAVSIPAGTSVFGDADNPIVYKRRSYNADGYKSFMNEIYCAEHAAGADGARPTNACIVVGGRYGSPTGPVTYYRIDLVKTTINPDNGTVTAQEYLPLLRNHRYKINILAVQGRGFDTPREAFAAMGLNTNLTVLITSTDEKVTEIVYDGQYMLGADGVAVGVDCRPHAGKKIYIRTDYPGGWKATTTDSWLHLGVAQGAAGVSDLTYTVDEYKSGSAPRSGTIELQAGRLFMTIKVTQSYITDIVTENVESFYPMDGKSNTFRLKSNYDWKVKVEDEYNIISSFTREGTANLSGVDYQFTLVDDFTMGVMGLEGKTAMLTFYSENDAFDPETVTIHGKPYFGLVSKNIDVYSVDQPVNSSWYVYANIPDNMNNTIVPGPGASGQVSPSRENSCASLPSENGKEWRLPTLEELTAISAYVRANNNFMARWSFTPSTYYWSATSTNTTNAYIVYVSSGTQSIGYTKTYTGYRARCVRSR